MSADTIASIGVALAFVGGICLGALWKSPEGLKWRLRWIAHEHDLARLEKRQPRKIEDFDRACDAEDEKHE